MAAAAERILDKVDAVLPEKLVPLLQSEALTVPEMACMQSELSTTNLGAVRDANNERKRLYMTYQDSAELPTERIV
jgi:predicted DNA-binding transcriptional regulator YafY